MKKKSSKQEVVISKCDSCSRDCKQLEIAKVVYCPKYDRQKNI